MFVGLAFRVGDVLLEGNGVIRFGDGGRVLGQRSGLGTKMFVTVVGRVSFLPAMAALHVFERIGGIIAFGAIAFVFSLCSPVSFPFLVSNELSCLFPFPFVSLLLGPRT